MNSVFLFYDIDGSKHFEYYKILSNIFDEHGIKYVLFDDDFKMLNQNITHVIQFNAKQKIK